MEKIEFRNPFRPGAGFLPPYLAGRQSEIDYFRKVSLQQQPVMTNLIISGLRGVGKTVLLDTLKPIALENGWIWAGTDMSESASVNESNFAIRLITDLSAALSHLELGEVEITSPGFKPTSISVKRYLDFDYLFYIYSSTPGLESDKLKNVLKTIWELCKGHATGIVIAYDEAQNLKDRSDNDQYPLSIMLEITQYVQRMELPFLLILTGLPTLFSNLVDSRTYAERMFHQMILKRLDPEQSREAITKPIEMDNCPVHLDNEYIDNIVEYSGGYPYFIQYICKEIYDSAIQTFAVGDSSKIISFDSIIRKLDADFYQGRWNKATDKQRNLLNVISLLENAEKEFSLKDIEAAMKTSGNSVSTSAINTMLKSLTEAGLIYKTRHGVYAFAVPLFSQFVRREHH
jgi:hypothetical protein